MISKAFTLVLCTLGITDFALAKLNVMTTTTDLKAITEEVGKDRVAVKSFCSGTQDPHFLEAKPSYMVNTSQADLVVAIGLGLEVGWLPKVLSGGRNAKVMDGANGFLEVGPQLEVLEAAKGAVSRADGDVHPEGNPHVTLDPMRVGQIAMIIAEKLASLDTAGAAQYRQNAKAMHERLKAKSEAWQKRIKDSGVKKAVTHHKTLTYFFDRFGIENVALLEPLPGVPPTANHVLKVIKESKDKGVGKILVENYFSDAVAQKVASQINGIDVQSVPVAVEGSAKIATPDDLFEAIVAKIETQKKAQ